MKTRHKMAEGADSTVSAATKARVFFDGHMTQSKGRVPFVIISISWVG